ncbi:hypothetical protein ACHRV5_10620 [Flavobacterium sp. FlaQc-52]|jgi:hypothetical protein|uniref:gp53-like domain-containing protein n=1 Tax=Flavobacterium sp. FlaQc-52 TaxID=3374185 RepID=UPI0037580946
MATSRIDIGSKFLNGEVPSEKDFAEIFNSFVHKDEDKADFKMVETGTDHDSYITPALLRTVFQNSGIISGNCYAPYKEYQDNFSGSTIELEFPPVENSVKVFKNGQLLEEKQDYDLNYKTALISFRGAITDRNIEINYWFQNLDPTATNSDSIFGNSSVPYKETFSAETFNNSTITLKYPPLKLSVIVYKNGQLLREGKDYVQDYDTSVLTFSAPISGRNIEVDYWFKSSIAIAEPEFNTKYVDLTTNQTIKGNKVFDAATESKNFVKTGGTANQYLMADGSVSSSTSSDYDAGHSPFTLETESGYQKLSNGLILQWAFLSYGSTYYNFPISFPTKIGSIVVSTHRESSGNKGYNHVYGLSKTGYNAIIDSDFGFMFAIGY